MKEQYEDETHTRIYKTDLEFLKKNREDMSIAAILHFIIQFYKVKK